jgi:deazaflavin-dependent oxidoreductase (nitroreductase family)
MTTVREILTREQTVEITTTGRRSGRPRRIETWRYLAAGRFWLTGSPGTRDWYANLLANPRFTLHVGGLDIECEARTVGSAEERARVLGEIVPALSWAGSLQSWLEGSPLAEILPAGGGEL